MTAWRALGRLAWRDLLRHKGRTLLVLVMIGLPVLGVTIADVIASTAAVDRGESIERKIGTSDAVVSVAEGRSRVPGQTVDGEPDAGPGGNGDAPTLDQILGLLGSGTRAVPLTEGGLRVVTDKGSTSAQVVETDLRDSLLAGTYRLVEGRLPKSADEVVVNPYLASRGPGLGDDLEVVDGASLKIVGLVEDAQYPEPAHVWGLPGSLGVTGEEGTSGGWLLDTLQPVTWSDVVKANQIGAVVISREMLEHPEKAVGATTYDYSGGNGELAIYTLIVIMALLEVVLLAGPSFAVGARRMQGQLAIVSANGGTPRQTRAAVLAMGAVVGALAATLGVLLGVPLGWALSPVAQRWSSEWFGPLDVPWLHLVGIAGFGFISALLAAIVPAWIASRQDVVQVLAGRRGDRKPTPASPILGVILIGIGLALTANGVKGPMSGMGETWIGFGAVFAVLGTVLLVPVFLAVVGKLASRTALPLRYAVRDAARHRTRTVPAIGAALASVAGVVALGIAVSSDEAQNKSEYTPAAAMGTAMVQVYGEESAAEKASTWAAVTKATTAQFPDAVVVNGIDQSASADESYTSIYLEGPNHESLLSEYRGSLGSSFVVADELPRFDLGVPDAARGAADRALAAGRAVVLVGHAVRGDVVTVQIDKWDPSEEQEAPDTRRVSLPAVFVEVDGTARAEAVFPRAVVKTLGLDVAPAGIVIGDQVSTEQQHDLEEAINAITEEASVYVERGYARDALYAVMLGILAGLGSLLMLGGTLTATFLALSDAKPDLGTLSAVGAAPRTRRVVAGAYALVIGGIGAVLGAVVGFVPGLAATWPLTANSWSRDGGSTHTIDIPWLLISGVVIGLPIFTALVVGLFARSRLPIVARVD